MKRVKFNDNDVFVVSSKDIKLIDKLSNNNYVIIYDGSVNSENKDTYVLAKAFSFTTKECYNIIKQIFPKACVMHNLLEIGNAGNGLCWSK